LLAQTKIQKIIAYYILCIVHIGGIKKYLHTYMAGLITDINQTLRWCAKWL